METVTEPSIPKTPSQAESAISEKHENPSTGDGGTAATPEMVTLTNETPDREKKTRLENPKFGSKPPTPDEKTEKKQRILVPKNGSMDRLKVPKSPNVGKKVNLECKTPTPVKQAGQKVKIGGIEFPKNITPNRLKVPIAFKYPERY